MRCRRPSLDDLRLGWALAVAVSFAVLETLALRLRTHATLSRTLALAAFLAAWTYITLEWAGK